MFSIRGRVPGIQRYSASPLGPAERKLSDGTRATIIAPSLDPVLAHLDRASRYYLHHFSTAVCQDLVSFDQADRNPFRGILPLAGCFDFLEAILVATGAMHLSALRAGGGQLGGQEFLDALAAKDRAIRLLRAAIQDTRAREHGKPI
ncbi:hypothetical protein VTJ04DRAFT_13 [Mycothermus thermophilus]|uniref:uncharacterized protein n=1 Tax=Humicola insolens TaxID=85995 RepID=UPI003743FBB7